MKKILMLLILGMMLACSNPNGDYVYPSFNATGGETIDDGLKWYDVVEYYYLGDYNSGYMPGGSMIEVDKNFITPDDNTYGTIAMIEFDDANDYVGAERGRILEGQQQYLYSYQVWIKPGYTFKVSKGDITDEQFLAAMDYNQNLVLTDDETSWEGDQDTTFFVRSISDNENIPIGTVLAHLDVYKSNDLNTVLGTFHIVM